MHPPLWPLRLALALALPLALLPPIAGASSAAESEAITPGGYVVTRETAYDDGFDPSAETTLPAGSVVTVIETRPHPNSGTSLSLRRIRFSMDVEEVARALDGWMDEKSTEGDPNLEPTIDQETLEAEIMEEAVAAQRIGSNGEDRSTPAPREDSGAGRRDDVRRPRKPAGNRAHTDQAWGFDVGSAAFAIAVVSALLGAAFLGRTRLSGFASETGSVGEQLSVGCAVRVAGLTGALQQNGKRGTIVGFIAASGRYEVRLEGEATHVSLRPHNVTYLKGGR